MQQMLGRDLKRFGKADVNNDSKLSEEEYVYFIHPEESAHMGDIIVDVRC